MGKEKQLILVEIAIIVCGAIYFCFPLLDFNPLRYPAGGEYILLIQTHFIWKLFPTCGACVLWNGFLNGGAPTFAELHNAPAHPFVAIPAILLGAINGGKITLLISFITAGLGQWRISKSLGLGRIVRVWTALMIMFAGELSGKMEAGNTGLILSGACCILFFSELYEFVFGEIRRSTSVKLAILLGLCLLSGQGYLQLGVCLLWIPASTIFAYTRHGKIAIRVLWETIGLTFYLYGFFLIPLLHFMPNFVKDADPSFTNPQPIAYSVLNLVIKDMRFFEAGVLGQANTPYAYFVYIGWIPVLLAIYGVIKGFQENQWRDKIIWLLVLPTLIYLFTSEELLLQINRAFEGVNALRTASCMTVLVVPPILTLAGIGLQKLLKIPSRIISWRTSDNQPLFEISANLLICVGIALLSVVEVIKTDRGFLYLGNDYVPEQEMQDALLSGPIQWVEPINRDFLPYFFSRNGAKFSDVFRPWQWKDHPNPLPAVKVMHHPDYPDALATYRIGEVDYYINPQAVYASLNDQSDLVSACDVDTLGGGEIKVSCADSGKPSLSLIVQENYYTGWNAWMDGKKMALDMETNFLTIHHIPAGRHEFVFRYQPLDVWIGLGCTLIGIMLSLNLLGVISMPKFRKMATLRSLSMKDMNSINKL